MRRAFLAMLVGLLALAGTLFAAPAAGRATTYTACDGVWVVVDYGSLGGGVSTRCATSFGTGTKALRSAGFSPTLKDGMILKINAKPSKPDIQKAYWSYWHASRKSNGSYSSWSYSNLGANAYSPSKGDAEGWRYQSAVGGAEIAPDATPPKNPAAKATATKTTSKSKSTSTSTSTSSSSSKKSSSSTSTAKSTASKKSTATASSSSTSTGADTATSSATASAVPTADLTAASDSQSEDDSSQGTPVGLIATIAILVLGGGGAAGWWFWKGRKR